VRAHINSRRLIRLATVAAIAAGVVVSSPAAHAADAGQEDLRPANEIILPNPIGGGAATPDDWSWA